MPVTVQAIREARDLLVGVARVTPVAPATYLADRVGGPVWLKCENLQVAGSFKVRGAHVRLSRLTPEQRARGVVAASAGNHAQGVAKAARGLGIATTVFMPVGAPLPKLAATRAYGADIVTVGTTIDDALVAATEFSERTGAVLIHPFDHEDIVVGQGTIGLEILEQVPDVRTVLVCTGGGGLVAGIATVMGEMAPDVRVIGVQAAQAAAYPASLAAGHPVALERMSTMADGIAVGRPGVIPLSIIAERHVEIRTVSEDSLSRGLLLVLERSKLLVEPAGAAGVAALLEDAPGSSRRSWWCSPGATSTRCCSRACSSTGWSPPGATCSCGCASPTARVGWPPCSRMWRRWPRTSSPWTPAHIGRALGR